MVSRSDHSPETLRQYALLADGERGALGEYAVTPADARSVWGGHYEQDTLIWRSRWVTTSSEIESREALAFPGETDRVVLLRRVEAMAGDAHVRVTLDCRAEFGSRPMTVRRRETGVWEGHTGPLAYRWSGVPGHARLEDGRLVLDLVVPAGQHHDLVLEVSPRTLPTGLPDAARAWERTERAWRAAAPRVESSAAPG